MERSSISAMRMSHLGKILSNFAILGSVLCLASVAYFLFVAFYYIILITVLLGTVFLILVYYPEFMNLFSSADALNALVTDFTVNYAPIIAPVTLAVSVLAIAALAVSKQNNVGRIVLSVICLLVSLAFTVIFTFMGGNMQ